MVKILAVCGNGLGSSLMLKINIASVVKELGAADVEVAHCDLASAASERPDLVVVANDLASHFGASQPVISLAGVMSKVELKEKLKEFFVKSEREA